jgi:hypothetical protein
VPEQLIVPLSWVTTPTPVGAQGSLRELLSGTEPTLLEAGLTWLFVDEIDELLQHDHRLVVLPAMNDVHLGALQAVVSGHALVQVIGVVADVTGHQSHAAIQSGAAMVVNLLVPTRHWTQALGALARAHLAAVAQPSTPQTAAAPAARWFMTPGRSARVTSTRTIPRSGGQP